MSWQSKVALLFIPLCLAACGFQPLYAKKDSKGNVLMLAGVKIDPINNGGRMGQQLKENLEDELNEAGIVPPSPTYRLTTTLTETEGAIGVSRDGTVSLYNVYLTSNYVLYRTSDDKKVTSGAVTNVSSYNNVANGYYSTYVAEQDAIKTGIQGLAEMYRQRLSAYMTGPNNGKPDDTVLHPQNNGVIGTPYNPFNPQNSLNPLNPYTNGASPFTPPVTTNGQ